jgi:hypothetical protein
VKPSVAVTTYLSMQLTVSQRQFLSVVYLSAPDSNLFGERDLIDEEADMPEQQTILSADQQRVLQLICDRFGEHGAWPTFGEIDRPVRKLRLRPEQIVEELARQGMLLPFQVGRLQPIGRDALQLTLLGLAHSKGGQDDLGRLLRLLPWLAAKELDFEPEPEQPDGSVRVSRSEIAAFMQLPIESSAIRRLRRLIELQRWGFSNGEFEDGEWYVQVDRNIYRFADVQTLDDYDHVMRRWEDEGKRPYVTLPDSFFGSVDMFGDPVPAPEPELEPYIAAAVVAQLESTLAASSWECTKLLALIEELNDAYRSGMTYAAHALLRAMLDHIPPLLGYASFPAVASSYSWSRTDKQYIKRLAEFRTQADDVLHRQISSTADLLTTQDMPQRVTVNRLLQECAKVIAAAHSVQPVS